MLPGAPKYQPSYVLRTALEMVTAKSILTKFRILPKVLGGELGREWGVRLFVQIRY